MSIHPLGAIAVVLYQPAMAYGLLMLASYWAGNARSAGTVLYMALGLAGPLTAWLFTFFLPPLSLIGPASLGLLYLLLSAEEGGTRDIREDAATAALEEASVRVAQFPDDGAAHLARAELLEEAGRWQDAREAYESAHRCSDRMLSAVELDAIRVRLSDAEQDAQGGGVASLESEQDTLGRRVELACLVLSALVFPLLPFAALSLAATMLFLRWFRDYAKRR